MEELTELKIIIFKRKANFIPCGVKQPMKQDFLIDFC